MPPIATGLTHLEQFQPDAGPCSSDVTAGPDGFASFSVASSQDFLFQGDGVTFHAAPKRCYFRGYYEVSSRHATQFPNPFVPGAELGK